MARETFLDQSKKTLGVDNLSLPRFSEGLETAFSTGKSVSVQGTNVVRVPFGVRRPIKERPQRPDRSVTLVLPFQPIGSPTPPPQAA